MVLIWLIERVFYKKILLYLKNEWMPWYNLLSKKPRRDTKESKRYYKNDKERIRGQAKEKQRNLSEEEKNNKREYGRNGYHNMSEEKNQRLKE